MKVSVLVALRRPDLVRGIVGLSADPDFTEDLLWSKLPLEEKNAIMKDGFREVTWGGRQVIFFPFHFYVVTRQFEKLFTFSFLSMFFRRFIQSRPLSLRMGERT